jgi:sugar transferase (PEP-CTERM/EpsH1 system associated)
VRILFLCHRVPFPPDKGDKIRAFHQLRAMAARHEVDVFTLADDPRDLEHRSALQDHCHTLTIERIYPKLARLRSLPYLLTRTPLTIPYFYSAKLRAEVRTAMSSRSYDRVYVYCSAMAQYVPWDLLSSSNSGSPAASSAIPVLIDMVDVDSDKWSQYSDAARFPYSTIFRKEAQSLRAYERQLCERAHCIVVSTQREAGLLRQIAGNARVNVVSNGVNTAHFTPSLRNRDRGLPSILFSGDMSYFPNQDAVIFFARHVLPLVRREIPDARFLIVGRNPDRRVHQLQEIEGVEVTGFVPDVRSWLREASVAVAPLRIAAGVQNKILEAMSAGLPVVATARAAQGLRPEVADVVEIADTAPEFARRVVHLLRNPQLAHAHGLKGRHRVAINYDWHVALERLLELVEDPTAASCNDSLVQRDASVGLEASA